jgi:hypothetical protein
MVDRSAWHLGTREQGNKGTREQGNKGPGARTATSNESHKTLNGADRITFLREMAYSSQIFPSAPSDCHGSSCVEPKAIVRRRATLTKHESNFARPKDWHEPTALLETGAGIAFFVLHHFQWGGLKYPTEVRFLLSTTLSFRAMSRA